MAIEVKTWEAEKERSCIIIQTNCSICLNDKTYNFFVVFDYDLKIWVNKYIILFGLHEKSIIIFDKKKFKKIYIWLGPLKWVNKYLILFGMHEKSIII